MVRPYTFLQSVAVFSYTYMVLVKRRVLLSTVDATLGSLVA